MEHAEASEKPRNQEAEVNKGFFRRRSGWLILAVIAALIVAGGTVIPSLLNRAAPEPEGSSSAPLALPTFTSLQDPGTSFVNGAKKLWELDLVAAFPISGNHASATTGRKRRTTTETPCGAAPWTMVLW